MNYAGEFGARLHADDGLGSHSGAHFHVDSISAHAVPSDAIIVPDANLLFNGEFKRSGVDLILSKDDHQLVLQDYFKGEKRAALSSPDGAHLTGHLVNALAGHVQYSQADGNASVGQVIGHVTKLAGNATAIRNGVSIILNQGDNVEKGDVVQSGSDSTLGITFIDGTVFGLSSNARMVLNEMVYDPNGSNNSSLLSLVAGTISFVAGETAKHGDMKIDTPVATMGIRGTAVLVEIDFDIPTAAQTPGAPPSPSAKFQVLVEPDGSTGSYILFDKTTLAPIATVNQAGTATVISNGSVNFLTSAPLSTDLQKLINDVFTLKFTDNTNPNTKLADHHTDAPIPVTSSLITLADGAGALPKFLLVNTSDKSSAPGSGPAPKSLDHIDGPPTIALLDSAGKLATHFSIAERGGTTGDTADLDVASGKVNFVDINAGDRPTVTAKFNSFTYQNAAHQDVAVTLTPQQLADIAAVEAKLVVIPDPANNNNGSANWTYSVPDSAFDFLAAGETLTLSYIAQVDNNFAPNDEAAAQSFTITITGANDAPVITTSAPALAFTGDHQANGFLSATDPTTGKPAPTGGTLTFQDPDLTDTHSVSVKLAVPPGSNIPPGPLAAFEAALTATIGTDSTGTGNGTINWQLAPLPDFLADFVPKDQSITLTYMIEVKDSQGGTATQEVTVTLGHATPPDEAWINPTGGLWSTASNWETGTAPTANDDVIIPDEQVLNGTGHYAVTIDPSTVAFAKSVTLNAENTTGGQLTNASTLVISGALTLFTDGFLNNFGIIKVGEKIELVDQSVLVNSGLLILENGGDFEEGSTVANFRFARGVGIIDLVGGTLNDEAAILNSGLIAVEQGASLTLLDDANVTGGQLNNIGALNLQDTGSLKYGSLGNSGQLNVSGTANALDGERVANTGAGAINITGVLTLDLGTSIQGGALTNSGTVKIESSSATLDGVSVENEAGTIQVDVVELPTVTLLVDDGTTIIGGQLTLGSSGVLDIEAGVGIHATGVPDATLDGVMVANGGKIDVGTASVSDPTLLLDDGATIKDGIVTIGAVGVIEVKSALGAMLDGVNVGSFGLVQVDAGSELHLKETTINGGVVTTISDGVVEASSGTSFINGATVNIAGLLEVTGGTLAVDAASTVNDTGLLEANGGNLIVNPTFSGSAEIVGASLIELGANSPTAYLSADITFAPGATGTLQLDHAEAFHGTVSGLDDNTLDLRDITSGTDTTITFSGDSIGGTLTIVSNADPTQVAHIELTGDYLGSHWTATSDGVGGGTAVIEIPGAIAGLDSLGHAVEGSQVTALITDGGQSVTGATYQWQLDGQDILNATDTNYLPTEGNEGHLLTVKISFTDALNNVDTSSVSAGTVVENPVENAAITLSGGAVEGQQITASLSGEADAPSSGITYTWTVDGTAVKTGTDAAGATYTPIEADEGGTLAVSVSFTDIHGNAESGSVSAGTVAESPTENATIALAGLTGGNAVQGTAITASVTEVDAPLSGITYTWTVNGTTVKTGTDAAGATYTPTEADEGKAISVAASFTDTNGFHETGLKSAGTVQEMAGGDLVATLDNNTAQQGVRIHVTGVKDGGVAVSTGVGYAWQVSSDSGQHWTTVGTQSDFTPGETEEGKLLQLVVTYADATGTESSTYSLGMPNDLVASLDSTNAQQGMTIHVTHVADGGTTVSNGVSYAWQVSIDSGQHWTTVGTNSSFTPTATVAGELLQVAVTFVDSGENESTIDSLGIVAPAKEWNGGAHEWQTPDQWSPSGAPTSSDNAVIDVSGTYKVTIDEASSVAHSLVVNDSGATVEIVQGGTLTLGGNLTIQAGNLQIDAGGTLKDIATSATITGAFTDNGTVEAGGGTLEIASAAISGTGKFKIDAGATLQIDHADHLNVVFAGSGEVILKDPAHFSGVISDNGGSLTAADVVDLAGFGASASVNYAGNTSGGTVTVSEAGHATVVLHVGANSTHWSTPVNDGHNGILIHDPPDDAGATDIIDPPVSDGQAVAGAVMHDPGPSAGNTVVASVPNQTLAGYGSSDTFVFNFAAVGHDTVTDFHPETDTLQFSSSIFANAQAALSAAQDDGHGNTFIALDAHDTITLSGVLKAQLHSADFHFV